jgi:N-acetylglucosaminyldiphosphoundecaprenol N-acetyl-beta-D-mannosaminyltransferase
MIDRGRHSVLGVNINAVDYKAAAEKIISAAKAEQPFSVSALAVHGVMTAVADGEHRYRINHTDLVVPDGQPVRWALNLLYGTKLTDRVYGPTLTLKVCEQAAKEGLPVYLYGSRPEVLKQLSKNLIEKFGELKIAGSSPSMFRQTTVEEKQAIVERIKSSGAKIVLLGLGCPRQEIWAYEYRDALSMPILSVGAAFDFHAGLLKQAPPAMQKYGLEWLFRLAAEPKRLWRRYLYLNPLYTWYFLLQYLGLKNFDDRDMSPPKELRNFG